MTNPNEDPAQLAALLRLSRREALGGIAAVGTLSTLKAFPLEAAATSPTHFEGANTMSVFRTKEGVDLFYKDWGPKNAQPIVFHHGWPLSSDDWDAQMLYFLEQGFRVIAHDRRGHGRSTQTDTGNDMDTYASDVIELADHLDLRNAVHIGHSTGGGEVARYVARARPGRVAKAVLVGAVPPIMVKSPANPAGTPIPFTSHQVKGFRATLVQPALQLSSGDDT